MNITDMLSGLTDSLNDITADVMRLEDESEERRLKIASMDALLDLLQPDIERTEKIIVRDERIKQLVEVYRQIRPE